RKNSLTGISKRAMLAGCLPALPLIPTCRSTTDPLQRPGSCWECWGIRWDGRCRREGLKNCPTPSPLTWHLSAAASSPQLRSLPPHHSPPPAPSPPTYRPTSPRTSPPHHLPPAL